MNQAPTAQRRHLTILFSDLSDSTRLSAAVEPEVYGELLLQLRSLFTRIIARHGGEIVRIDGDGVLSIFGHSGPIEDGGRRATEAAIDLHAGAALLDDAFAVPGTSIRLHSGVHSGVVLLSSGDMVRGRFEILGDATNLAAHLCDEAGPDEILVSEAALGPDIGFYHASARRMVRPKGAALDLPVFAITGRAEVPSRFEALIRRGVAPFVGRSAELRKLTTTLEACPATGSSGIIIIASSGMGKSRLVSEFVDQLASKGIFAHRGYCEAYLGSRSLQPFVHILRSVIEMEHGLSITGDPAPLADLLPDHHSVLKAILSGGDPGGQSEGPPLGPGDASDAVLALINLNDRPLILCIDDWQWVDEASQSVLETVMRDAARPIFAVLASRDMTKLEGLPCALEQLHLLPLSEAESRATIDHLLGNQSEIVPSRFHVQRIVAQAGGCPLFIEELCQTSEHLIPADPKGNPALWLEALVQARCAALPETVADLVQTASVIGENFPVALLQGLVDQDIDIALINQLIRADFIYPGERPMTLRFKHGVTRDAVYRTVGLADRKRLHRQIVDFLIANGGEDAADLELLAYHTVASGNAEGGVRFAMRAGNRALAASALDRAQYQFQSAFNCYAKLGAASSPAALREIVTRYGRACVIDPSLDQLQTLREMVELARDEGEAATLAVALYWLGSIEFGLGHARSSIQIMEEALTIAAGLGRESLVAQIKASLGEAWFDIGAGDRAAILLEDAVSEMRVRRSPEGMPAYLFAVANLAQVFADRGDFSEADRHMAEVDQLVGSGQPVVVSSLMTQKAAISLWKRDYAEAIAFAEQAEVQGLRDRSRQNAMIGQALRGYAQFMQEPSSAAADDLFNAVKWREAASYQHQISLFYGWTTEVLVRLDRPEEARAFAARCFWRARAGDSFGLATAAQSLARLAAQGKSKGNRDASHYLAIAYRSADNRNSPRIHAETEACEAELAALTAH